MNNLPPSEGPFAALGTLALQQARDAANQGQVTEALDWLARVPAGNRAALELEAELRYRNAAQLIAARRYGEAERELRRAGGTNSLPRFLIDERLRLLRRHQATLRAGGDLLERFGAACERCVGPDLYRIATCEHQLNPVPRAEKLTSSAFVPEIESVYAAAAYRSGWDSDKNEALSKLIRGQKREMSPEVMRLLGIMLSDFVAFHTPLPRAVDILVPVPTSRERAAARGGSLPHLLATTVADRLAIPLLEPIVQVGVHVDHTQAYGEQRRHALQAAWEARNDGRIRGRSVLLVDDIVTTGTTMSTMAELLRAGGAGTVHAAALLHTERSLRQGFR